MNLSHENLPIYSLPFFSQKRSFMTSWVVLPFNFLTYIYHFCVTCSFVELGFKYYSRWKMFFTAIKTRFHLEITQVLLFWVSQRFFSVSTLPCCRKFRQSFILGLIIIRKNAFHFLRWRPSNVVSLRILWKQSYG